MANKVTIDDRVLALAAIISSMSQKDREFFRSKKGPKRLSRGYDAVLEKVEDYKEKQTFVLKEFYSYADDLIAEKVVDDLKSVDDTDRVQQNETECERQYWFLRRLNKGNIIHQRLCELYKCPPEEDYTFVYYHLAI